MCWANKNLVTKIVTKNLLVISEIIRCSTPARTLLYPASSKKHAAELLSSFAADIHHSCASVEAEPTGWGWMCAEENAAWLWIRQDACAWCESL